MPYLLSLLISPAMPGMWQEDPAYLKRNIYTIEAGKLPPVHYDEHTLKPHSLTYIETPAHTQIDGNRLEYFLKEGVNFFYGRTVVLQEGF